MYIINADLKSHIEWLTLKLALIFIILYFPYFYVLTRVSLNLFLVLILVFLCGINMISSLEKVFPIEHSSSNTLTRKYVQQCVQR